MFKRTLSVAVTAALLVSSQGTSPLYAQLAISAAAAKSSPAGFAVAPVGPASLGILSAGSSLFSAGLSPVLPGGSTRLPSPSPRISPSIPSVSPMQSAARGIGPVPAAINPISPARAPLKAIRSVRTAARAVSHQARGGSVLAGRSSWNRVFDGLPGRSGSAAVAVPDPLFRAPASLAPPSGKRRLLDIRKKGDSRRLVLTKEQLEKPFLIGATIEKGTTERELYGSFQAGEKLVYFKLAGKRIQLYEMNVDYRAEPGSPAERAIRGSVADSLLASAEVRRGPGGSVAFNLDEIFTADLFNLRAAVNSAYEWAESYELDGVDSVLKEARVFENNAELAADLVFGGRDGEPSGALRDNRRVTVAMRYSLSRLPEPGFVPRSADERIGYFQSVFQDWTDPTRGDPHVRMINRWRLEKTDPGAELSPVKKPIVWTIENTVPLEHRETVEAAILKWNLAFERIGFKNAIVVRRQPDPVDGEKKERTESIWTRLAGLWNALLVRLGLRSPKKDDFEFDPADARNNVFRWNFNTDADFAYGPARVDPRTGEIYNAGVSFSAGMVADFESMYDLLAAMGEPSTAAEDGAADKRPLRRSRRAALREKKAPRECRGGHCAFARGAAREAAHAIRVKSASGPVETGEKERIIKEYVTMLVMHEIGHTLGLRHNFLGAAYKTPDELAGTRDGVISGSVMDYMPANIAMPGEAQGTYFQSELGPYDFLAVEYGYKNLPEDETAARAELARIAAGTRERGKEFATDEDATGMDPDIAIWTLGSDPLAFARREVDIALDYWNKIAARVPDGSKDNAELQRGYWSAWNKFIFAIETAISVIGGIRYRRMRPDGNERPLKPYDAAKQREALEFLDQVLFAEEPFAVDPEFAARLTQGRRTGLGGAGEALEHPQINRVVGALRETAFEMIFDADRLDRIAESENLLREGDDPFTLEDLFFSVYASVWEPVVETITKVATRNNKLKRNRPPSKRAPAVLEMTTLQREMQLSHIDALNALASGELGIPPDDAVSLAVETLDRLTTQLGLLLEAEEKRMLKMDRVVKAHIMEAHERAEMGKSGLGKILMRK